nr:MAG TPA: hypothetical protein [Caudoviricetes sp.]
MESRKKHFPTSPFYHIERSYTMVYIIATFIIIINVYLWFKNEKEK